MKIPYLFIVTLSVGLVTPLALAQNKLRSDGSANIDLSVIEKYVVLMPDWSKAIQNEGLAWIPFILKNNSNQEVRLTFRDREIHGLATRNKAGQLEFIQGTSGIRNGFSADVDLKPGQSAPDFFCRYAIEDLAAINGAKVFGVEWGHVKGTRLGVTLVSASFVVPRSLTTIPWTDLGENNYLSLTPDLAKVYWGGGNFRVTTLEAQRADPNYADLVKNGWAERVSFPITITNTANHDVAVAIDEVRFYILGDDQEKNRLTRDERWECLKITQPVLKPSQSISSETSGRDYITLKFLEGEGYKPGDKIVAIVGGRIPSTNNIFECYSAPFELPLLPKGEPPISEPQSQNQSTVKTSVPKI